MVLEAAFDVLSSLEDGRAEVFVGGCHDEFSVVVEGPGKLALLTREVLVWASMVVCDQLP